VNYCLLYGNQVSSASFLNYLLFKATLEIESWLAKSLVRLIAVLLLSQRLG
jgi:hypothetical protein